MSRHPNKEVNCCIYMFTFTTPTYLCKNQKTGNPALSPIQAMLSGAALHALSGRRRQRFAVV